jgi:hypothetical protein
MGPLWGDKVSGAALVEDFVVSDKEKVLTLTARNAVRSGRTSARLSSEGPSASSCLGKLWISPDFRPRV